MTQEEIDGVRGGQGRSANDIDESCRVFECFAICCLLAFPLWWGVAQLFAWVLQ